MPWRAARRPARAGAQVGRDQGADRAARSAASGADRGAAAAAPSRRTSPSPSGHEARAEGRHRRAAPAGVPRGSAASWCPRSARTCATGRRTRRTSSVTQSLRRGLHTLKGSARMAGAIRLGELTHLMESRIESAIEAERLSARALRASSKRRWTACPRTSSACAAPVAQSAAGNRPGQARRRRCRSRRRCCASTPILLDHLINEAGEVSIARSRVEAELRLIRQSLHDLTDSVGAPARAAARGRDPGRQPDAVAPVRARGAQGRVRSARVRPLHAAAGADAPHGRELERRRCRSSRRSARTSAETDAALLAQTRTTREVQQELMRMRAVPFANLNERLYRVVRQIGARARQEGRARHPGRRGGARPQRARAHRRAARAHAEKRARPRHRVAGARAAAGKHEAGASR